MHQQYAPARTPARRSRGLCAALAAATLFLAACQDAGTLVSPGGAETSASILAIDEHAAAAQLARAVAMALDDAGLRQRVKQDMRKAPMREHKLHLGNYLHGNGGILLAKMSQQTGRSREALLELLNRVRPLEFYMPVPDHREAWTGGPELLVAWRLDEEEVPAGYTLAGRQVQLDRETPPSIPTLVLVPVETDFSMPVDREKRTRNVDDRGGESIGTLIEEPICPMSMSMCPVDPGDGGGTYVPPPPPPAGIYFNEMVIYDNNEPWTSGSPEIEVHFRGLKKGVVRDVFTVAPFAWPQVPSVPIQPWGVPYFPPFSSDGSGAFPNLDDVNETTRFYPNEYEWVFADCSGAQATAAYHRFDYNDEGGARHYDLKAVVFESKFTIRERISVTNPVMLFWRTVPLLPPFEIYVVERDDGRECPNAEAKFRLDANIEMNLRTGPLVDMGSFDNVSKEDIRYLLGRNNDPMGRWWVNSYAQLEALSNTWLPRRTDDTEIDDVIIRVSNQGFSSTRVPPQSTF